MAGKRSKDKLDRGLHQVNAVRQRLGLSPVSVEDFLGQIRRRLWREQ
jgi:hypothetical protein